MIGFLPGYLQQEDYTTGTRYGIIGLLVTGPLASAMAVLILAAVAFAVLKFGDPDRPWQGAVVMTAAALAVTTPRYQWYALLLVVLVALDGRPEWLAFAAGAYYAAEPPMGRYTVPYRLHDAVAYGIPVLVVAAGWLVRRELARRGPVLTETVPAESVPAESPFAAVGAAVTADHEAGADSAVTADREDTINALPTRVPLGNANHAKHGSDLPARVRAFLPVGYPQGKDRTISALKTVNRNMSYDPSQRRLPPRQGGWPLATPPRPWRAYREDSAYPGGTVYRDADQAQPA